MILDLLFPKRCLHCKRLGSYICGNCALLLKHQYDDICPSCFSISYLGLTHTRCMRKTHLDGALSVFKYEGFMKRIVKQSKYRFIKEIYSDLYNLIDDENLLKFRTLVSTHTDVVLQPIPLHIKRSNWRGFNQSDILADFFRKKLRLPVVSGARRIVNTKPQAYMKSKNERKVNIINAFQVTKEVYKNKTVILVDDIFTSGSTANELARLIKEVESKKVYLFSLAHGSF